MELVKWQFKNPYHDKHSEQERLFVFGSEHTVRIQQKYKDPKDIDLHHNTGFLVWDGSFLLAQFIYERLQLAGKSCLELGAGTNGLASIVAYLKGASSVIATDLHEYQPYLQESIRRNTAASNDRVIRTQELKWGSKAAKLLAPVDIVFGSEILYLKDQHTNLLQTLSDLIGNTQSTAYFIYKDRGLGEENFHQLATSQGFQVRQLPQSLLHIEFQQDDTYHLLQIKKSNVG